MPGSDCFQQLCGPGITQVKPGRRILEAAADGAGETAGQEMEEE